LPLHEEDQDLVEDLLLSNEQSIEGSRANLKSITNIRDAYTAISSNNLNRTIEILTMITVAVQIPNLFYAMFGMNVHVPWQNEVRGFWVAIAISLLPLILLWIIAKRRRIL
jgi:magnesium transporter